MRTFNLAQPGAQLPEAHARVFAPSPVTAEDARLFFTYQNVDKVAEKLADHLDVDAEDLHYLDIDTEGDIAWASSGPKGDASGRLDDVALVELALSMGYRDWIEPNYPPLPRMR